MIEPKAIVVAKEKGEGFRAGSRSRIKSNLFGLLQLFLGFVGIPQGLTPFFNETTEKTEAQPAIQPRS